MSGLLNWNDWNWMVSRGVSVLEIITFSYCLHDNNKWYLYHVNFFAVLVKVPCDNICWMDKTDGVLQHRLYCLVWAVQALTCSETPWWLDIWRLSGWYCRSGSDCGPYRSWTQRQSPPLHPGSESDQNGTPCSASAGERNPCLSRLGRDIFHDEFHFYWQRGLITKYDLISCVLFEKRKNTATLARRKRVIYHAALYIPPSNPNILTTNKSTFQFIKSVNWIQVASSQTGPLLCA